ncbi:hypothetical protein GOV13_03045 [Candidatus Pacearchaeota archaeon]|nr:hypothetical protein [Candidatus Pacearchaeota archaeon]
MVKNKVVNVRIEEVHKEIFEKLKPYFGSSTGEVIRNLALRWVETNIANENIVDLAKRGVINLEVME